MQEDGRAATEARALSSSPGRGTEQTELLRRQNVRRPEWKQQGEDAGMDMSTKEGKERAEGRRSSGAALKRTKSKGREGSRGWMWRKSFCARLHKGTLIWHAITGWVQWKRGRTRRAADSQGQWLCNVNETPYKGCLVQWLLPQTLCCYRPSEMKLEEINCFHWI